MAFIPEIVWKLNHKVQNKIKCYFQQVPIIAR